jgi:hypothetical protein
MMQKDRGAAGDAAKRWDKAAEMNAKYCRAGGGEQRDK